MLVHGLSSGAAFMWRASRRVQCIAYAVEQRLGCRVNCAVTVRDVNDAHVASVSRFTERVHFALVDPDVAQLVREQRLLEAAALASGRGEYVLASQLYERACDWERAAAQFFAAVHS